MKFTRILIINFVSLIGIAFCNELYNTTQFDKSYNSIILFSKTNIKSGTENIISIHSGISSVENMLLRTSWFKEDKPFGKVGNAVTRFAKYVFVDLPISYSLIIINHEYYGHGARYREFGLDDIEYHYELSPYGPGGSYATISSWPENFSTQKKIAIWHAGLETHDLLNKQLNLKWFIDGQADYNENIIYLWAWQHRFQYIQSYDQIPDNINGAMNDPQGYIWLLNYNAGIDNTDDLIMDLNDLQKKDMINLINPFLWYSLYAQFKTYMLNGQTQSNVPILKIKDLQYLPSMRMTLTPFGPQYHLENYIKYNGISTVIDISCGDQTFYNDWWGLGVQLNKIYRNRQFSYDLNLDIWNQPILDLTNKFSNYDENELGFAGSLRLYYNFNSFELPISLFTELGYKTSGFLQGYPLDKTIIYSLGISL